MTTREPQILPIVTDVEKLKTVLDRWVFTEDNFKEAHELQEDMHATIMKMNILSLAHNQVGGDKRVIVIRTLGAMFNPRVVHATEQEEVLDEASASFPGLIVKVKRPFGIRVRFQIADGTTHTEQYNGITARAVLNAIDHIDGELFYNRASRFHRDQGFNKQKRLLKNVRSK